MVFDEGHTYHAATPPLDIIRPDDVLPLIVGPFHEHVGPELLDQSERRVLVEQHDAIHGGQSRDESSPLLLRHHRAIDAFAEAPHRRVAVDPDDEGRTFGASGFQECDVARVQEIKYPICEDDLSLLVTPARGLAGRADLRGGVQSGCDALGWNEKV